MNNTKHTHQLSLSWWIGYIVLGSFLTFITIGTLATSAQDPVSSTQSISDYLGTALLLFVMLPSGLGFIAIPFVTKIIVKAHGLEYHTITYILLADWNDLVNIGYFKNTNTGKSLVVVPRGGMLTLRKWAKPFRSVLKHNPADIEILISQFRTSNGHSFETDILVNVAQRGTRSEELESL